MLNVMRKHAGSWMIKVILFAIVIVFAFWGVGSFRSRQATRVAKVNETSIGLVEYRRTYNSLIDQYRQRFGSSLNEGMIEMLQVKTQALNQLIDRVILLQEAQKLGLRVSDAEVADSILNTAVFQTNGSFDNRRYRRLLGQVHLTPEEYEAEQKNLLLRQKLARLVTGAAKVSEKEARQWYDWQYTTVSVDYVRFEPEQYTDIAPSKEQIADYYEKEKANYKTEPKRKVRYVVFAPERYQSEVRVDEVEIVDYYESHLSAFETEKTVEARHILLTLPEGVGEEKSQEVKARAEEIASLARQGGDFAELAKTHSEGPTKEKGGYLGKFTRSQMVKPFADQAFSMKAGEISEPVKTQFGWHVIKVEAVEEASTKSMQAARQEIIATLTEQKARNLAYDRAVSFFETIFEEQDFIRQAKAIALTVMETDFFTRQGPPSLGADKAAFADFSFSLEVGEVSDIQEIGGRYYLVQPMETVDALVPPLEDVLDDVKADLIEQLRKEKARSEAEAMAKDFESGDSFAQSAKKRGVDIKTTGLFERNANIPDIGSDSTVAAAAFRLPAVGSVSESPVEGLSGVYLLRLAKREAPEPGGFAAQREAINERLLRQKQRTILQDWLDDRKSESQITIENEFLE